MSTRQPEEPAEDAYQPDGSPKWPPLACDPDFIFS
jgi:hypothetical protein